MAGQAAADSSSTVGSSPVGSSASWVSTDSPVDSSAPRAATKASMARRPLISSAGGAGRGGGEGRAGGG